MQRDMPPGSDPHNFGVGSLNYLSFIFHILFTQAAGFPFKPGRIIRRHLFIRQDPLDYPPVPVAQGGWKIHDKGHQGAIIAILNTVPMLMGFQGLAGIPAGEGKYSYTYASPALPHGEVNAISKTFRFMPCEDGAQGQKTSGNIKQQTPGKGS